jgi:sugar phosphate isomerase/epimerase
VIDIPRLRQSVENAGYSGPIEVEIFNEEVWQTPVRELIQQVRASYLEAV